MDNRIFYFTINHSILFQLSDTEKILIFTGAVTFKVLVRLKRVSSGAMAREFHMGVLVRLVMEWFITGVRKSAIVGVVMTKDIKLITSCCTTGSDDGLIRFEDNALIYY